MVKAVLFALAGILVVLGTIVFLVSTRIGLVVLASGAVSALLGLGLYWIQTHQLAGFVNVPEEERGVVEAYGKYKRTLLPGLAWVIPGIEKVRARVIVSQQTVPLLDDSQHLSTIEFPDAVAKIIGAAAFVRTKSPDVPYDAGDGKLLTGAYRTIYGHVDWEAAVKDLAGNALRAYLGGFKSINDAFGVRGAYNMAARGPSGIPDDRLHELDARLAVIGIELDAITVQDFETSKQFQDARESRGRAAAENEALAARSIGMVMRAMAEAEGLSDQEMKQKIARDPGLRDKFVAQAMDLLKLERALDKGAHTSISTTGGGGVEEALARLLALWKK